jgi:hypothetical protein
MAGTMLFLDDEGQTVVKTETIAAAAPPAAQPTQTAQTAPPATTATTTTPAAKAGPIPACADADIPERPTERTACRTSKALLQIIGQAKPIVVGGTMVRVLSAQLDGSSVVTRLRVRNETKAEQGAQAGGQELYLNVAGKRIDSAQLSRVRIPPMTGRTVKVRYVLAVGEIDALRKASGAAELGVRPWDGTAKGRVVGVIRMRVRTPPT